MDELSAINIILVDIQINVICIKVGSVVTLPNIVDKIFLEIVIICNILIGL